MWQPLRGPCAARCALCSVHHGPPWGWRHAAVHMLAACVRLCHASWEVDRHVLQADEGFTAVVLLWRSGGAASCSGVALGGTCGSCSPQLAVAA